MAFVLQCRALHKLNSCSVKKKPTMGNNNQSENRNNDIFKISYQPSWGFVITCCIFSKSRHGRCIWWGRGVCLCLLRGEAALGPLSVRTVAPSFPAATPGDPLVSPPPPDDVPSRPLFARLSTLVGGDTDRSGLWASMGGEVLNWTGGRGPVVKPHTSSSLLPENI